MYSHHRLVRRSPGPLLAAALGLLLAAAVPAGADHPDPSETRQYEDYGDTAGYEGSYSYVRTLEGSATLIQGDTGDRDALQVNQPLLVGDRIWVSPRGRAEVVLSDRNLLRIDGGSEVVFEALAGSPDRQDRNTVLRLPQGNVQLVVTRDFLGEGVPRVDTPNMTVYPRDLGSFRITADGAGFSEVVARDGSADVVTREGSLLVRAGEEAVVEGDLRPRQRVRSASRLDSLELWGQRLDREARYAASGYVDDSIRYESASLDRYGTWMRVDSRYAWRPRVAGEWRPYHHGRWSFSPLGLTWVSYEPWGWVPYHYGSWDYLPGHGWLWFPGHRFSPAWVYWYWTDHYAGWVPIGYYTRHYRPHFGLHFGFRFGHYGWAGGHWGHYDRWTFCSTRFIGFRDQHHHALPGHRFGREHRYAVPKRGLVTTDTRGLTRTAVRRAEGIEEALAARRGAALPDVTDFVARRNLPEDVRNRVLVDAGEAKRSEAGRDRAQVLAVDGIPGATSARRLRDAVNRDAGSRTPARTAIDRGGVARGDTDPSRAAVTRKPAVKPEAAAPTMRPDEGFRARPEVRDVERALPRGRAPEASRPEVSRPETERPRRIESKPAPAPAAGDDWRRRAVESRRPTTQGPDRPERRVDPRVEPPAGRSVDRPDVRRIEREASDWRQRNRSSDPRSIPRRVIEGVRSNPGSTPFRPDARTESRPDPRRDRVESRPAPSRPSPPARVQSRPSRSRPSSPPPSARSRSGPSRPSSPPPSARSSSRRSSSRATSSRSSAASSSSRGKARRKPPGE